MPASTQFGDFFSASQLEEAVITTLELWMNTYLREAERQFGLAANSIKNPVKYSNRRQFTAIKGEALPRVVVISPGLMGAPQKNGQSYSAVWRVGVGVACAAQDEVTANMLAKTYGLAARSIVLQKRGLGTDGENPPYIRGISWLDESYDDLPIDHQTLLYKSAAVWFGIEVDGVVTNITGPDVPDQPDYPSFGQVPDIEHIFIVVENEGLQNG